MDADPVGEARTLLAVEVEAERRVWAVGAGRGFEAARAEKARATAAVDAESRRLMSALCDEVERLYAADDSARMARDVLVATVNEDRDRLRAEADRLDARVPVRCDCLGASDSRGVPIVTCPVDCPKCAGRGAVWRDP